MLFKAIYIIVIAIERPVCPGHIVYISTIQLVDRKFEIWIFSLNKTVILSVIHQTATK